MVIHGLKSGVWQLQSFLFKLQVLSTQTILLASH